MGGGAPPAGELPQRLWPGPSGPGGERQHILGSLAAVRALARVVRPCYGPLGLRKLLVTAKGESVLTGHTAAILGALELEHPAARLLREAALGQGEHSGDGVAFVVLLAEALLAQAERLLLAGLPRAQLREAFAAAAAEALALMPRLAFRSLGPLEDPFWVLYSAMNTHSLFQTEYLTKLVTHACWVAKEQSGAFRPELLGVCTLPGGLLEDSCLLPGLAVPGSLCGQVTVVPGGARVALFACSFGLARTKTAAAARLSSPAELVRFKRDAEKLVEKQVAQLATMGVNVAVVWGDIEEQALTQADRHGIMVIQVKSRRELAYLGTVLGTPLMPYLIPPLEPGKCQQVYGQQLGEGLAVVFEWEGAGTPALTLVLRGATKEGLRGTEQAVYGGIDAFFQLCQDPRLVPGAGALEMALAKMLLDKGAALEGPDGPAFLAFARALRSLPEALAENAGLAVPGVMADMAAAHQAGHCLTGLGPEGIVNAAQEEVWDILSVKVRGLGAAAGVAIQLATVGEIVVAGQSATDPQDLNLDPKKTKECPSPGRKNK